MGSWKTLGGAALLAGAAAAVLLGQEAPAPAVAVAPGEPRAAPGPSLSIARSGLGAPRAPLFEASPLAQRQAGAALPAAARPANAVAPPFPLRYAGWFGRGSQRTLYMSRGNEILAVQPGDVVHGFRIDSVGEAHLEVTWLAGGERQLVSLAEGAAPAQAPGPGQGLTRSASTTDAASAAFAPSAASGGPGSAQAQPGQAGAVRRPAREPIPSAPPGVASAPLTPSMEFRHRMAPAAQGAVAPGTPAPPTLARLGELPAAGERLGIDPPEGEGQ